MMQFYMTPGSCTTAIHILLEEIGLVFQVNLVNLMAGDQHKPEYLALNPKGTIPTLGTEEGRAITDLQAIAWYLARKYPRRKLLPDTLQDEVRAIEIVSYAVNTIHGQGFTRVFTTDKYSALEKEQERIKAEGKTVVENGLALVDSWLDGRDYCFDHFTVADAAVFYNEFWAAHLGWQLPDNCRAHYERMLKRPAVQQVLIEEGYGYLYR